MQNKKYSNRRTYGSFKKPSDKKFFIKVGQQVFLNVVSWDVYPTGLVRIKNIGSTGVVTKTFFKLPDGEALRVFNTREELDDFIEKTSGFDFFSDIFNKHKKCQCCDTYEVDKAFFKKIFESEEVEKEGIANENTN